MVMTYDGVPRKPEDLSGQVYLPERAGSLQPEMLATVRSAGLLPYVLEPTPDALFRELAAGHPVVVLLNLRAEFLPEWHYAVLFGYDLGKREVMLRSGENGRLVMSLDDFERAWDRSKRWAFVALKPDQMPAKVTESEYIKAAADLEKVSPGAAQTAYVSALAKWPDDLVARMGLGNVAYRLHDLAGAEMEYGRAAKDHPDAADAWNNLAQVLHELGRNQAALVAAKRAVAIGGARMSIYESTLDEIRSPQ